MVTVNINKDSEFSPKVCDSCGDVQRKGVYQDGWFEVDATEAGQDVEQSKDYTFTVTVPDGQKWKFKVKVISERVE